MKLKEISTKPKLIKVVLDNEKILQLYDEPLEFWMWDRQELVVFLKMAQLKDDHIELMNIIRELILDETGLPMLEPGEIIPMDILVPVSKAVVDHLGNSKSQTTVI
jgi:hypothetical protein